MNKLIQDLRRRGVFKAALSYIVGAWVFLQAASIIFPLLKLPDSILRACLLVLLIGFPFWILFAYLYERTPDGIRRTEDLQPDAPLPAPNAGRTNRYIIAGLAVALVLLIAERTLQFTPFQEGPDVKTIAVLPIENLSPDDSEAFFAAGIHEDLMNKLSTIKGFRVVCRTSVKKYQDYEGSLKEVADRLGAGYFVEGSVRRSDQQVRISASLIDGKTEQTLWSDHYDRQLENIFDLQSTIAQTIARTLETRISLEERKKLEAIPTKVMEAYDQYLAARQTLTRSWTPYDPLMEAIGRLEKATKADPEFSEGWALLCRAESDRYEMVSQFDGREDETEQSKRAAIAALSKAEHLQAEGFETLKARGHYQLKVLNDPTAAMKSFDRALQQYPNDGDALFSQAQTMYMLGQYDRSAEHLERAFRLDQENGRIAYFLTFAYETAHQYARMVPFLERLQELEPEKTHYGVQAKYYQFLAEGSLETYEAFEQAVRHVERTEKCDDRAVQNNEMVVAMVNHDMEHYTDAYMGKWDQHYKNHGNWSCPMIINDDVNHAFLMNQNGYRPEKVPGILAEAESATTRPINENSLCIFNKQVFQPKIELLKGDTLMAKRQFEEAKKAVLANKRLPRASIERRILLETADLVVPEQVYALYRQIVESPSSFVSLEVVCANPWIFPNLLRNKDFRSEIEKDGRFVEFLEHYGFL